MAVNKVILLGNLGADVTVRHLPDGRPVGNVNIATTEVWRDREGEKHKHTEWHRLNFFGRQAEIAGEYLHKGSQIFVEGQLRTRKWTDKENIERQTTEIRVLNFQMLGSRGDRDGDSWGGKQSGKSDSPAASSLSNGDKPAATPASSSAEPFGDMDEDLPW